MSENTSGMLTIGRMIGENALAFSKLDINWNQRGLNLIMGRNLDDVKGNSSRNGTGKSSLMKVLETHIFPNSSGMKVSEVVNDDLGKDYVSILQWQPANSPEHYSYQYNKHTDWGNGANIYKGGTYEQFEAGQEGVFDVSYDDSRDCQRAISELMHISYDEWTLLSSLIDIGNDDVHPFFASNRAGRLELVQNLYGLNYSQINAANKEEMKTVKRELDTLGVSVQSSLKLLEDQLKALPPKEEVDITIAVETQALAKLEKQLTTAASKVERIREMQSTWDRYNVLKASLTQAQVLDIDLKAELDSTATRVEELRLLIETLGEERQAMASYVERKQQLTDMQQQLETVAGAFDMSNIEGQIAAASSEAEEARSAIELHSLTSRDLADLTSELSPIDSLVTELPKARQAIVDAMAALPDTAELTSQVTHLQVAIREANNRAADATLLNQVIEKLQPGGYAEYAMHFTSAQHLLESSFACKQAAADQAASKQKVDLAIGIINTALSGATTCPTCEQPWCKHTQEELDKMRSDLPTLQEQSAQHEANSQAQAAGHNAMNYLATLLEGRGGELYWQWRAGTFQGTNEDVTALNDQLADAQAKLGDARNREGELKRKLTSADNVLRQAGDRLALLDKNYDHYNAQLNSANDRVSKLKSIQVMQGQLNTLQTGLQMAAAHPAVESVLAIGGDIQAAMADRQVKIQANHTDMMNLKARNKHLSDNLSNWLEIKTERFADIDALSRQMIGADITALEATHAELTAKANESRQKLATANSQVSQRADLEARYSEFSAQTAEIERLESHVRMQKAVDLLSGPRGLMVKRTETLFHTINTLLNQYLSVLIQDGQTKGRPLTAWLEMSNNSVDLNCYRGDVYKSKKSLSTSEKARVKLALTLAMREVAPRSKLPNVLLLDEIDGSSCETNSGRIWDCVQMYLGRNPNTAVWAVSHDPSVQQSGVWNNIYEIVKLDGKAQINLLESRQ